MDDIKKTIEHIFYTISSCVHRFKAMGQFNHELQSGNAQFGSKSAIYFDPVTLKFDGWPWKTTGHLSYAVSSCVHHFITVSEFKLQLQSGKGQFGSKSMIFFCPVWPWNLTNDLGKTIEHLYYSTSSFVHHFVAIGELKLKLQSRNGQLGSKSTIFFLAVWPWNLTDDLEKQ